MSIKLPNWRDTVRIVLVLVGLGGMGLFFDHIAHYGICFHIAPVDHGIAGLIMIVISIVTSLVVFRWKKGDV
jgi:hypothetical protein